MDRLLADAGPVREEGPPVAVIAPHAGFRYSGQTAARAIKHLAGRGLHTVIILGASHHQTFNGAAVYGQGGMRTPLGVMKVNEALAQEFLYQSHDSKGGQQSGISARPELFEQEHVIEVLLPLLQGIDRNMLIVPVLTGTLSQEVFDRLVKVLSEILRNDSSVTLLISADFSHYHDYATAEVMDAKLLEAIKRLSVEDAGQYLLTGEAGSCGKAPLLLGMSVAQKLGAGVGQVYEYRNTGDATGERRSVVGYAAAGFYRKSLGPAEKAQLLSLARKTVEEYITLGSVAEPDIPAPWLKTQGTTFVSISRSGELRGCIGNIRNPMPLYKSVILNAVAASSKDPRFPPVKKEELADVRVEVSVLSLFEPVRDLREIEIGKHGLYLVKGGHSALLLPQVADEGGWDLETFLEKLSVKAGLKPDGWSDAQLYRFTAEVIR